MSLVQHVPDLRSDGTLGLLPRVLLLLLLRLSAGERLILRIELIGRDDARSVLIEVALPDGPVRNPVPELADRLLLADSDILCNLGDIHVEPRKEHPPIRIVAVGPLRLPEAPEDRHDIAGRNHAGSNGRSHHNGAPVKCCEHRTDGRQPEKKCTRCPDNSGNLRPDRAFFGCKIIIDIEGRPPCVLPLFISRKALGEAAHSALCPVRRRFHGAADRFSEVLKIFAV